jgi:penicillin-binding protein 2
MIEQGGTGASSAAPMLRTVYNGLLGAGTPPVLAGATPEKSLPHIAATTQAIATSPAAPAAPAAPRIPAKAHADGFDAVPTPGARVGKPS